MSGFDYGILDVVQVLHLRKRRGNYYDCPFCGETHGKLNINVEKNVFRCNRCDASGGMLKLYADLHNVTLSEANQQIREALGKGEYRTDYIKATPVQEEKATAELAPIEEIHRTYQRMLSMLTLNRKHQEDLQRRGLKPEQIEAQRYRSVPLFGMKKLVKRLAEEGYMVKGVPGFYRDTDGNWTINFKAENSGILIPIVSLDGFIQGFQIRVDHVTDTKKYIWLSSVNYDQGVSSGTLIGQWVTITIENDIKKSLMESILYIKNRYLEQYEKGALLNRIEFDVETIAGYYIDLIGSILMIILNSLIAIYFIFQISIKLSLVAIVFLPFSFLVNYFFRNKIRMIGIKQKEINDQYLSYNGWIFININSLKAFGRQKNILERFSSFLNSKLDIDMKGTKLSLQVSVIRAILSSGLNVALLTIAGILIMDGEMTIGNLVAFNSYLEMLYQAISKMLELNLNKQGVIVSCERLGEIRFAESELKGEKGSILDVPIKEIEFDKVCFSYSNEKSILSDTSFTIKENGLYSFVGENGCGKTTILKLLEKFYDVEQGQIKINKIDINDYEIFSVRENIAYMSKEPFFIYDTVYENIRLANNHISEDEIEDICRQVGLHKDIMKMQQQYRSLIESDGGNLSNGQKQKLSFARIMACKKASLYLLDEITSDLDGIAEKNICDLVEEIAKHAIIICVSHKEELLKRSRKILVIEEGKVMDTGTHESLLNSSITYKKLYENQREGEK